jgi:hypothetical protein
MQPDRLPTIDELAAIVESRTAELSPAARLRFAIELGRDLSELSDELIGRFVTEARNAGLSWNETGHVFGISKEAAQQRYGPVLADPSAWPDRWSPAAQLALERAGEEARRLGHD